MTPASGSFPEIDPSYACFKVEIRSSPIHRYGVYALERIPARRKVIEYTGERISRRETKRRSNTAEFNYLFTLDKYWALSRIVIEWPGYSSPTIVEWTFAPQKEDTTFVSITETGFTGSGDELAARFRLGAKSAQLLQTTGPEGWARGAFHTVFEASLSLKALDLKAGKPVSVPTAPPYGCSVKYGS